MVSTPNQTNNPNAPVKQTMSGLLWELYLRHFDVLIVFLSIFGVVAAFLYGLSAGGVPPTLASFKSSSSNDALRGGLAALALAGGALMLGALIGFLFGLPRSLTSGELRSIRGGWTDLAPAAAAPAPAAAGGAAAKSAADASAAPTTPAAQVAAAAMPPAGMAAAFSEPNTNLEHVSDWLTKILVGVGLTQLEKIPDRLDAFGANVAHYFGYGGKVFAIGGGLYFLILGFFLGYVGTRVKLTLVFTTSQRYNAVISGGTDPVPGVSPATVLISGSADPVAGEDKPEVRDADEELLARPEADFKTPEERLALANAYARRGQRQNAERLYREVVALGNATPEVLAQFAKILALSGKSVEAGDVANAANVLGSYGGLPPPGAANVQESVISPPRPGQTGDPLQVARLRGDVLSGLYEEDGKGYEDAIAALEMLMPLPGQASDPWVHIWRACAYAQRYKATLAANKGKVSAATTADRNCTVDAVKTALALDNRKKDYLASLYFPGRHLGVDDDLEPLYDDPELTALLR